jgi:cell division protein ZapA (FtsZ GTPase activity inhibitor)
MQATLRILNEEIRLHCDASEQRRLEDLAAALNARLAGFSGDGVRQLALAALALMDEAQATNAALVRACAEIERLTDLIAEAGIKAEPSPGVRSGQGRVKTLHTGAA